jgi:flagellar motor switch protein FliG
MPTAPMTSEERGIRKAAVLVASLDRRASDRLLAELDAETARKVRGAVETLGAVPPAERAAVLHEFMRRSPHRAESGPPENRPEETGRKDRTDEGPAGIELSRRPPRRVVGRAIEPPPAPAPEGRPFAALRQAEADRLARLLAGERPQTIALVLSHLMPEQSARILAGLPAPLMTDAVRRLMDLEQTGPDILREIEEALVARLSEQVDIQRQGVAGVAALADILAAADPRAAAEILERLDRHDRSLAAKLAPPAWRFDDLRDLHDDALALVFRRAEPAVATIALIGADPELVDRILGKLPSGEAAALRRRLHQPGPLRLSDVEEARRQVAELARRLSIERRIPSPADRRRAAAMVA